MLASRLAVTSVACLLLLAPAALAGPVTSAPAEASATERAEGAAASFAGKAFGGRWRAVMVGRNQAGVARVRIERSNPLARQLAKKARGVVWVDENGEIVKHQARAGRARIALAKAPRQLWDHPAAKSLRSSQALKTIVAAGAATFLANQLGVPYEHILPLTTSLAAAILAKDAQTRTQLSGAADKLAAEYLEKALARAVPEAELERSFAPAYQASTLESLAPEGAQRSLAPASTYPAETRRSGPTKIKMSAAERKAAERKLADEIRKTLGID